MRVACILADDFEDSEFRLPAVRLRAAGHAVEVIGAHAGEVLHGKRGRAEARVTRAIAEAHPEDYAALLVPGGRSPARFCGDERFLRFVRAFFAAGKPVAAICHGAQVLIAAGVVRGRTMTAWPTVQEELRAAGAQVLDQEVVVDGDLVTSRRPDDLEAFARELLARLAARAAAGAEAPRPP